MAIKQCTKCNTIKSLDDFHNDWTSPDCTTSQCKKCMAATTKLNQQKRAAAKKGITLEAHRKECADKIAGCSPNQLTDKKAAWRKHVRRQYADAIEAVRRARHNRRQREWKAAQDPAVIKAKRAEYQKTLRVPAHLRAKKRLANPASMTRKNLYKKAFKRSKDQFRFTQRIPRHWNGWDEMKEQILDIYMVATTTAWALEMVMPVDHIIPLNGYNVSGLHVPSNLRIMTAEANEDKGNTYEP